LGGCGSRQDGGGSGGQGMVEGLPANGPQGAFLSLALPLAVPGWRAVAFAEQCRLRATRHKLHNGRSHASRRGK
jgi:hypothetical protein